MPNWGNGRLRGLVCQGTFGEGFSNENKEPGCQYFFPRASSEVWRKVEGCSECCRCAKVPRSLLNKAAVFLCI